MGYSDEEGLGLVFFFFFPKEDGVVGFLDLSMSFHNMQDVVKVLRDSGFFLFVFYNSYITC